jgi:hypothetical protein
MPTEFTVPVTGSLKKRIPFPFPLIPILSEDIYVCCVGHSFSRLPNDVLPIDSPPIYIVEDFLVDQSQSTGGGALLADPLQFDLAQSSGYRFRIFAGCSKRFHVTLPNGVGANFSAYLGRQDINPPPTSGYGTLTPSQIAFQALTGPSPNLTGNFIAADTSALVFEIDGQVNSSVEFEGIIMSSYFSRSVGAGAKWYSPLSFAVPLGTKDISPKSETFVSFFISDLQS